MDTRTKRVCGLMIAFMAFMFWWIVADLVDMKASWSGPLILALVAALLLVCAGLVLLVRYASGSESAGSWIKGFCIVVLFLIWGSGGLLRGGMTAWSQIPLLGLFACVVAILSSLKRPSPNRTATPVDTPQGLSPMGN
ncbi:Hypothetical protein PFCIRM134_02190 [Propionibacterium freudenreichii]|nr:Hypothetical protein PFCIRM118_00525 [Propionibacterium freudenreichii]CEH05840.1 Hypothetical protein PFCIRM134_02190 [Propionibacterium freudenreichii]CEI23494.1 Hypothetical protein PFCIRM512_07875 [Propionibacterium freudenreichii]CEI27817.1 Hypothetical protein PFCIRM508_10765 [Propionibacterium freudenreichii]